jgi:hypothetical protein
MSTQPPTLNTSPSDAGIDISPISPADRRNSLEKHLQTRPEEQDLKNRHILLDTNAAPSLQAKALELERQRATDNLKKGLGKRPERGELVDRELFLSFPILPLHHLLSWFPLGWRCLSVSSNNWLRANTVFDAVFSTPKRLAMSTSARRSGNKPTHKKSHSRHAKRQRTR